MYLQEIAGVLQGHDVKIKYDCSGGFEQCGKEKTIKLKYAEKNFKDNDGKHICRKCFLKYKNPMKKAEVKEKVKKTCVEKYGSSMPMNSKENIEKRKELFKDENYKKQWVEKHKKTNLERYGVDHPVKLESIRNKQKQTLKENYGVEYPYQSKEIMDKMKSNNLEKYGVENVASLPEVQIKMARTTLERYGVEHYNELPEMKDYLKENCKEWLVESWANPWAKGITRPDEWNQKARETIRASIQNGTWKGGGKHSLRGKIDVKKCKKKNPWFRSSYELKVHIWLELSESIDYYDYEPFEINYIGTDGHSRLYFPDFLIFWSDKTRKPTLVEVKNSYMAEAGINLSKNKSAIQFTKEKGLEFEVWEDNKIKSLDISLSNYIDDKRIVITNGDINNC